MMMIYISMPAVSKLFARERILIPSPAVAPVVSAAINVVSATEIPSRTAVKINGVVAGKITLQIYLCLLRQELWLLLLKYYQCFLHPDRL